MESIIPGQEDGAGEIPHGFNLVGHVGTIDASEHYALPVTD